MYKSSKVNEIPLNSFLCLNHTVLLGKLLAG